MEKPKLSKILKKLEQTKFSEWSANGNLYYRPEITKELQGLTFCIKTVEDIGLFLDGYIGNLEVQNEKGTYHVSYYDRNRRGKIKKLYDRICRDLIAYEKKKLFETLEDFLLEKEN